MRSIYLSTSEGRLRDTICVQNSVEDGIDLDGGLRTGYDLIKFPTTANIFKYEIERRTGSLSNQVTASEETMTVRVYAKDSPELREKVNRLQKIVESSFDISIFTLGKWTEKKCFVSEIIISSEFDEISWETTEAHIYYLDVDIKFNYITNFRDAQEEIIYGRLISRNGEINMYSEVVNDSDKYASVEFSMDLENYKDEFGMIISPVLRIDNNVITNGWENVKSIHVDLKTGTVRHDGKITDYVVFAPDEKRFIAPGDTQRFVFKGNYAGNLVETPFTKIITKEKKELM